MPLILKYLVVYILSGIKIIFGPTLGLAYGFTIVETVLLSLLGMMTTVYLLSYFGEEIRTLARRIFLPVWKKKVFTPRRRRLVRIWNKWGVPGIAFLTPLLLSPIGGAILVNALGGRKQEIFKWMWIFGGAWSLILTFLTFYAGGLIRGFGIA